MSTSGTPSTSDDPGRIRRTLPEAEARLRVLAQTAYPLSTPASRVRIAGFGPFLEELGIALEHYSTLAESEYEAIYSRSSWARKGSVVAATSFRALVHRPADHDLRLVQRLALLTPFPGVDPPRRLDVYDFDDALYARGSPTLDGRFRWAKQEARRWAAYLARARLVIAGNSILADHARQHTRRVEVVPSCVNPAEQEVHVHRETECAHVGWIGSQTTSEYLHQVLPVFERLNAKRLRAKLVLVGADPTLTAPWIEHRPWSLARERQDLADFDVGIMPQLDTEWARGKCGYKVLQYFAAGVPAVASPVGVARELIGRERGILAESPDEWQRALETLLADAEERRQRGAVARDFVKRCYSYQRWAPELAALLRSIA